jgi:hypothetical protein
LSSSPYTIRPACWYCSSSRLPSTFVCTVQSPGGGFCSMKFVGPVLLAV